MSGLPLTMTLSDLGCEVKRIRCAAALLLMSLVENHRANQRMLRRSPGFTVLCRKENIMEKDHSYCRIFWAPLKLRGEYIGDLTRTNQLIEARNNGDFSISENEKSPKKRRKIVKPSENGFMNYLKKKLTSGMHLEKKKNDDDKNGEETMRLGNKAFLHTTPSCFACYPAARLYKAPSGQLKVVKAEDAEEIKETKDGIEGAEGVEQSSLKSKKDTSEVISPPSTDRDGDLLDWCPDPAEHLLSFPILENDDTASLDTDNIVDMVQDARLRSIFDQLGERSAIPYVSPNKLKEEPIFCVLLGDDAIDSMIAFFLHQRKKSLITWADVCEFRRYYKYSRLSQQQGQAEKSLFSGKPLLLKKFKGKKVFRDSSRDNKTELLTNMSVFADPSNNRLYIDVTLHPSDGSKYRVYIQAPPSDGEINKNLLLTLPNDTLETLTKRVILPSHHAIRTPATTKYWLNEAKTQAIEETRNNIFKSMEALPLVQVKLGGSSFRPKATLKNCTTIKKVLRAALVLGKSLWQQSRVEDAFDLMQHAAVRGIEVMPTKSERSSVEDDVLEQLFRVAKRAKLVGRRDPAISVMLYRSTFSNCLLQLMGRSIDRKEEEIEMVEGKGKMKIKNQRKKIKTSLLNQVEELEDRQLDYKILKDNQEKIQLHKNRKLLNLEQKERKMNKLTERRKRIQKEEKMRRQQERIDARKKRQELKQAYEKKTEREEDLWYAEGKRLEQIRLELERKQKEEQKKLLLYERAEKKRISLEKRKRVEAARIAAIELKAKNRGVKIDVGFCDGRT